jgi:hypothetical protein
MGCGGSKEEGEQEVPIAFNPKDIYFDRTGNLRYGGRIIVSIKSSC